MFDRFFISSLITLHTFSKIQYRIYYCPGISPNNIILKTDDCYAVFIKKGCPFPVMVESLF